MTKHNFSSPTPDRPNLPAASRTGTFSPAHGTSSILAGIHSDNGSGDFEYKTSTLNDSKGEEKKGLEDRKSSRIESLDDGWVRGEKMGGGVSGAATYLYRRPTAEGDEKAIIKTPVAGEIAEAIAEIFYGRFIRRLNQRLINKTGRGDVETTAEVDFVVRALTPKEKAKQMSPETLVPDATGANIRVRSRFMKGEDYQPLWKRMGLNQRRRQFGTDQNLQRMFRELGPIKNQGRLLVLGVVTDSMDAHIDNMGVVKKNDEEIATLIDFGKTGGVKTKLTHRHYDDKLHPENEPKRYLPGTVTHHISEYPRNVRYTKETAEDYEVYGNISPEEMLEDIQSSSRDFASVLGTEPLRQFFTLQGMPKKDLKGLNAKAMVTKFNDYFLAKTEGRQRHAREELVPQIKHSLCFRCQNPGHPTPDFALAEESSTNFNLVSLLKEYSAYFNKRNSDTSTERFKFLGPHQENSHEELTAKTREIMRVVALQGVEAENNSLITRLNTRNVSSRAENNLPKAKKDAENNYLALISEFKNLPKPLQELSEKTYFSSLRTFPLLFESKACSVELLKEFSNNLKQEISTLKDMKRSYQSNTSFYLLERIYNNHGKYKSWSEAFYGGVPSHWFTQNENILTFSVKGIAAIVRGLAYIVLNTLKAFTEVLPAGLEKLSEAGWNATKGYLWPKINSVPNFFKFLAGFIVVAPFALAFGVVRLASKITYLTLKRLTSPEESFKEAYAYGVSKTGNRWVGRGLAFLSGVVSLVAITAAIAFVPLGIGLVFPKIGAAINFALSSIGSWLGSALTSTLGSQAAAIGVKGVTAAVAANAITTGAIVSASVLGHGLITRTKTSLQPTMPSGIQRHEGEAEAEEKAKFKSSSPTAETSPRPGLTPRHGRGEDKEYKEEKRAEASTGLVAASSSSSSVTDLRAAPEETESSPSSAPRTGGGTTLIGAGLGIAPDLMGPLPSSNAVSPNPRVQASISEESFPLLGQPTDGHSSIDPPTTPKAVI